MLCGFILKQQCHFYFLFFLVPFGSIINLLVCIRQGNSMMTLGARLIWTAAPSMIKDPSPSFNWEGLAILWANIHQAEKIKCLNIRRRYFSLWPSLVHVPPKKRAIRWRQKLVSEIEGDQRGYTLPIQEAHRSIFCVRGDRQDFAHFCKFDYSY